MRGGGIFTSEFGSLSGEPVLDTKKQMACADDCGAKYGNDLVNYNICYGQCWTSAYVPDGGTTTPGTTTPGTTTSTTKCSDSCAQYPVLSLDYVKCQAGCAGIGGGVTPQPGGVVPGGGGGGGGGGGTVTPGVAASQGTSPWLIAGIIGVIGVGAYYMLGKKKTMTPNRRRRGRK